MIVKFLERFGAKVLLGSKSRDVFTPPKIILRAIIHHSLQKTTRTLGTHCFAPVFEWLRPDLPLDFMVFMIFVNKFFFWWRKNISQKSSAPQIEHPPCQIFNNRGFVHPGGSQNWHQIDTPAGTGKLVACTGKKWLRYPCNPSPRSVESPARHPPQVS